MYSVLSESGDNLLSLSLMDVAVGLYSEVSKHMLYYV